jgi:hypothetical protein
MVDSTTNLTVSLTLVNNFDRVLDLKKEKQYGFKNGYNTPNTIK